MNRTWPAECAEFAIIVIELVVENYGSCCGELQIISTNYCV